MSALSSELRQWSRSRPIRDEPVQRRLRRPHSLQSSYPSSALSASPANAVPASRGDAIDGRVRGTACSAGPAPLRNCVELPIASLAARRKGGPIMLDQFA